MSAAVTTIDITAHAIQRFRDRVRPGLDLDAAADELARLVGHAELTPCRPEWLHGFAYLYLVAGDVALRSSRRSVIRSGSWLSRASCATGIGGAGAAAGTTAGRASSRPAD